MKRRSTVRTRGSILVMSLLVVTIGALIGTSIIYYAGADRRAAEMGVMRVQARAMAWSGVQAVMAELAEQREALLAGEPPIITESWISPVAQGTEGSVGARWGFRVLPVAEKAIWSEMGKLDVNDAPAEVLARLPGMSEETAARIVERRKSRRFMSVAELLGVEGMTPELLYGSEETESRGSDEGAATPLSRLVTVYSFDPEVQVGFGTKASDVAGKQRININTGWSEELGRAIEERFDRGIADGVKDLMERGEKFEKPSSIVKKLRELRVEPKDWVEVVDAFTTNPDQYRLGAVDLLTAPAAVLECVPGITPEAAEEIVARREKLDIARRGTVVWPVLEDIIPEEDFEKCVDYVTSRSLQWKVVVEGGVFVSADEGEERERGPDWEPSRSSSNGIGPGVSQPLKDRVVLEAVIDVSSLRCRVAYLREVTFLPTARQLAAGRSKDRELVIDQEANEGPESGKDPGNESLADGFHTELNTKTLDLGRSSEEDDGEDLELATLEREDAGRGEAEAPEDGGERPASPTPLPAAQDRRLGRWTTGSGGSKE